MKMEAAYSQILYPTEVNARQRSINHQRSAQENQMCCFDTLLDSGDFRTNGGEKPMAAGQPEEVICNFHERDFMGFANICHRHNSFDVMNYVDPAAVKENFSNFTNSVKSEIDTIPGDDALNAIETDIRNFETSVKETLDNFTNELLNFVQDQTKLFNIAYDKLINAISGYVNSYDSDPEAELPDIDNTGDVADSATADSRSFKFEEFEIKFREKFIAALDELLNELKEATYVQDNFIAKGIGTAYENYSGNYDQMMESNNSNDHETFTTTV